MRQSLSIRIGQIVFVALAGSAVAGCSGGGGTPGLGGPPSTGAPSTTSSSTGFANVSIAIVVPSGTREARRRPAYVSGATASYALRISSAGNPDVATSGNCTTVCSASAVAPIGNDTFAVSLYDGPGATGNVLSTGSTVAAVGASGAVVSLALGGVPARVTLTAANATFVAGAPAATTLQVRAYDAAGNEIVGSDPFATPIALATTGSGFSLGRSSVASPADEAVSLAYDGSANASGTIAAALGGTTATLPVRAVPPTQPLETASAASAFVDAIGVNVHLSYYGSAYGSYASVKTLLTNAGIRHVRDGMVQDATFESRIDDLAAAGVHATLITNVRLAPSTVVAYAKTIANPDAIESPNEYDLSGDANWASTLRAYTQALYGGLKADAATANVPVVGPSLTSSGAYGALGDQSAYLDFGNMHDYLAGFSPENTGYGDGGYGSVSYDIAAARQTSGTKAIAATETGYGTTAATHGDVDEATQAKYVPRLFFTHFLQHVARTFTYELIDEGAPSAAYSGFGLVRQDFSVKPAYNAVAALTSLLADSGTAMGRLSYGLSGNTAGVQHVLLEKSDGSFYIAYWIAASSYDVNAANGGAPRAVAPQNVTFTFGEPVVSAQNYAYDATGHLVAAAAVTAPLAFAAQATDGVQLLKVSAPSL